MCGNVQREERDQMMKMDRQDHWAFMFPGVGMDYKKHIHALEQLKPGQLKKACEVVEEITGKKVWGFIHNNDAVEEENENDILEQLVSYVLNCITYELYKERSMTPTIASAYSMGLYSALACAGAVSFETGVELIIKAYECMKSSMTGKEGSMASIIGLTRDNIRELLEKEGFQGEVEIVNENNEHSLVIAGVKHRIQEAVECAKAEGALKAEEIRVSLPYHSSLLKESANEFIQFIQRVKIEDMAFPLISCIDGEVIRTSEAIEEELAKNLISGLSWMKAIEKMGVLGARRFVEVGTGDALSRVSRFINSSFEFFPFQKVVNL